MWSRSTRRSSQYRAAPDVAALAGPRLRFVCVLSRRTNTEGERGELLSHVRYSDADRDPAGSYGGGVPLSVLLAGLAKSRVQPVLVYFQVEGALGNPELLGNPRQVALASRDRCADGVALDGVKIRNRRRLREDVGLSRPPAPKKASSSGSCAAVTVSSSVNMTMPSTTFRISRTFPGQAYRSNASITFASKRFTDTPWRCDTSRLKCSTSSAMSSLRSRSAGMRSVVTDTR